MENVKIGDPFSFFSQIGNDGAPLTTTEIVKLFGRELKQGYFRHIKQGEIIAFTCRSKTNFVLPVIPTGTCSLLFYGKNKVNYGLVCGPTNKAKKIVCPGNTMMISLMLPPDVVKKEFGADINELRGKVYDIRKSNSIHAREIFKIASEKKSIEEVLDDMIAYLERHIGRSSNIEIASYCVQRICETGGQIKTTELAKELGYSSRYIGKIFVEKIGIPTKEYSEIIRMLKSLVYITTKKYISIGDVAKECGFYDHTHMNKAYQKFFGASPSEIRKTGLLEHDYDNLDTLFESK